RRPPQPATTYARGGQIYLRLLQYSAVLSRTVEPAHRVGAPPDPCHHERRRGIAGQAAVTGYPQRGQRFPCRRLHHGVLRQVAPGRDAVELWVRNHRQGGPGRHRGERGRRLASQANIALAGLGVRLESASYLLDSASVEDYRTAKGRLAAGQRPEQSRREAGRD